MEGTLWVLLSGTGCSRCLPSSWLSPVGLGMQGPGCRSAGRALAPVCAQHGGFHSWLLGTGTQLCAESGKLITSVV